MDFRTKTYLTLTKQQEGLLGSEMYVDQQGLSAYGGVIHDPHYYLANADRLNWKACAEEIAQHVPLGAPTMEYGTGDYETAQKTGEIVKQLDSSRYTGVDLSRISINQALSAIIAIKRDIEAVGLKRDFWDEDFPISDTPTLALFAGGAIQNFEVPATNNMPRSELVSALSTLGKRTNGGWLLVSTDMWLPNLNASYYERAYTSPIHSIFNLSVFSRMKGELGVNLDPQAFSYRPVFNERSGSVQHMAIAKEAQSFVFEGDRIRIRENDKFLLQNSFRFTEQFFNECAEETNMSSLKVWKQPKSTMWLHLLRSDQPLMLPRGISRVEQPMVA